MVCLRCILVRKGSDLDDGFRGMGPGPKNEEAMLTVHKRHMLQTIKTRLEPWCCKKLLMAQRPSGSDPPLVLESRIMALLLAFKTSDLIRPLRAASAGVATIEGASEAYLFSLGSGPRATNLSFSKGAAEGSGSLGAASWYYTVSSRTP